MPDARIDKAVTVAQGEVGVHEGRGGGHWNNIEKYAPAMPDLAWAQGQPWCVVFLCWVAEKAGMRELYPRTASVPFAAAWFKSRGQWSEYPAIGAWCVFGHNQHIGQVVDYDDTYVWTVEGNTNTSGSAEGDGVYLKQHRRRDPWVLGYGYPAVPLRSADPSYHRTDTLPTPSVHSLGVDYSFARPEPAKIKKAGYVAAGRYLSNSPSKNISAHEAAHLHAAGLGIWLVWETTAKRAAGTSADGSADANAALAQAQSLGLPADCPIFFAVDFDASWEQVNRYLAGASAVLHDRVGVYGGFKITTAARSHGYQYTWQTVAWSGGKIDTDANLYQRLKPTVTHPVKGTDENLIQRPFPLWTDVAPPAPTPPPTTGIVKASKFKRTLPTGKPGHPDEKYPLKDTAGPVAFRAPVDGVTTSGTKYARDEYREMVTKAWSNGDGKHHELIGRCRVTEIPGRLTNDYTPGVVFAQFHDGSDDIIILLVDALGRVILEEGLGKGQGSRKTVLLTGYRLGDDLSYVLDANDDGIDVTVNGQHVHLSGKRAKDAYSKAGCYLRGNASNATGAGGVEYDSLETRHAA